MMDDVFPVGWTLADRGPGPDEDVPVWAILADGSIALMASVVVGDDADGDYSAWAKVYNTPWWDQVKGEWKCEPDIDDSYDVRAWLPLPRPPTLAELAAPKANAAPDPALLALATLGATVIRECIGRVEPLTMDDVLALGWKSGISEGSAGRLVVAGVHEAIAALLAPDAGEVANA